MLLFAAKPKSTTFIITSPEPEAGKSTIAANLAASLSEQGNKVVLVDMDLHCPRLHSIFGIPNEMGLSNFLKGEIEFDAMLHPTTISNLRVVVAGSSPDFSSEWLAPTKIGSLLKLLEKECNYLLIDTAALLSVADPMVLASQVDAVILVVAERKTGRQNLLFALRQLSELKIKIAGIVLNRVANSQLYSYYSEQNLKRLSSREGNGKKRILIDAHSLSAHKNVE
jgi:non-specific protein-tyrosine kinase